jgi:hypothetical protein
MLIAQIVDPADLVELSPRQYEVLETALLAELVSSEQIRNHLQDRAQSTLDKIKSRRPRSDFAE